MWNLVMENKDGLPVWLEFLLDLSFEVLKRLVFGP